MSGFTPGPWRINSRGNQVGPRSDEEDQSFGMIMPVAYLEELDWPDAHKANARLIAAAPELLEALEQLSMSFIGEYSDDPRSDEDIDAHRALWEERARAAIAKARGTA